MRRSDRHIKKPEDSGDSVYRGGQAASQGEAPRVPLVPGEALDYYADPKDDGGDTIEVE
jgi:hypothetical protein